LLSKYGEVPWRPRQKGRKEPMKRAFLGLVAIAALAMTGCSKDAEVEAFMKENEAFSKDVAAAAEKDGADAAKKMFDEKKGGLKAKYAEIKEARNFQVTEENRNKLNANVEEAAKNICGVKSTKDLQKMLELCKEYQELLQ
jgi:hypothetical protein